MQQNKEQVKLFRYGLGFLLFCFVLLFTLEKSLSFLVSNSNDSQTGKINLIMGHKVDPEILIVGSSVAEVGFNSNLIGRACSRSVFNAAIDGTTVIQSHFIIDEFLNYSKNCKQILVGLAFFSFEEKTSMTEPSRYMAHFSNPFVKTNIKEISPNLYYKLQYVPFYAFTQTKHTYYKNAALGMKHILQGRKIQADQLNGFVPHFTSWNGERIKEDQYDTGHIQLSENAVESYIEIIKKIQQHNIEPILIITPMYIDGQNFFGNYDEFVALCQKVGDESDVRLLDFSRSELVNDGKNFYNNGHLNNIGADLFSRQIADSLVIMNRNSLNYP